MRSPAPLSPPIDSEQLDAFVTFAEHLNFTRAARARGMSQPALHTQIRKLSDSLAVTLYERRGNRLTLTPHGERLLAFGRDARDRSRALLAELSQREVSGPITLCAGEGSYLYLLGPGLRRFVAARSPDLRLLVRDQQGTVAAVRTGEAHLGVASLDKLPPGLEARLLTEVGQALVLPAAHPLASKRTIHLRDLDGARLVVPPEGRPHTATLVQAFRAAGARFTPAVEASGWELLVRFAELGLGLAIVNAFVRLPDGLVRRPIPELPSRPYYLLQRSDLSREGPISALADSLAATANAWRR
ncbi:MAG: LysR family transcriptional regulator [Polyangiaceae bacterium]